MQCVLSNTQSRPVFKLDSLFPKFLPAHPNNLAPPCNNISNQNHSETEYRQTEIYSLFQAVTHFFKKVAM